MPKSNFLLVDLNEPKTKKLAETITSDTSRKILNHLAERKDDTEAKMAEMLQLPLSTVHYHLQKLQEAGLILVEEFHYSPKGREVNHYKLANKYIIIAPQKVEGLREKLKGILPVTGIVLGISALVQFLKMMQEQNVGEVTFTESKAAAEAAASDAVMLLQTASEPVTVGVAEPNAALWFFLGGMVTVLLLVLYRLLEYWRKRS